MSRINTLKQALLNLKQPNLDIAENKYVVIGYNHNVFRQWARRYGVSVIGMVFVDREEKSLGWQNYNLILLPASRLKEHCIERLINEADVVIDAMMFYPVTETGKIVRWVRLVTPKKEGEDDGDKIERNGDDLMLPPERNDGQDDVPVVGE